jgi:hypothetical protein
VTLRHSVYANPKHYLDNIQVVLLLARFLLNISITLLNGIVLKRHISRSYSVQSVVEYLISGMPLKCYQVSVVASESALLNYSCDSCFVDLPLVTLDKNRSIDLAVLKRYYVIYCYTHDIVIHCCVILNAARLPHLLYQ